MSVKILAIAAVAGVIQSPPVLIGVSDVYGGNPIHSHVIDAPYSLDLPPADVPYAELQLEHSAPVRLPENCEIKVIECQLQQQAPATAQPTRKERIKAHAKRILKGAARYGLLALLFRWIQR